MKRKLTDSHGVTFVFALAVFMILTLFSCSMVNGSLTALQGSVLLRNSEKACDSVNSAARLIRNSLQEAPYMTFEANAMWTNRPADKIVKEILVAALNRNAPLEFLWSVKSDRPEAEDAFVDVRLSVTATHHARADLEKFLDGNPAYQPTFTIQFLHPDYKMTMRVAACAIAPLYGPDGAVSGYQVAFADERGDLDLTLSLGAS